MTDNYINEFILFDYMDEETALEIIRYWNQKISFKPREDYCKKIKLLRKNKEIIALIGVRRSGKSTLLRQEIEDLRKENDSTQMIFLNFEDPRISNELTTQTLEMLFQTYKKHYYKGGQIYIFLDEIQNIIGWEKWVRTKQEVEGINIYVTGSSSKLLSQELATVLTGRSVTLQILPLSFKEFKEFRTTGKPLTEKQLFKLFLEEGGFPKVALIEKEAKIKELQQYFESILLKDVVARYNLKNSYNLQQVALFLVSNSTKLYSANKIKNMLKISLETALNYVQYLKEAQLFFELKKYDSSLKTQENSQKKIYCVDTGILHATAFKISKDKGRILENAVFIELKRQELEIYYHRDKNECDFVIKERERITQAVQVCYELNKENKDREIKGLKEAMEQHQLNEGLLLTNNQEETIKLGTKKIIVKPVWKWLN